MNPINKVSQVRVSSPLFSGLLYAFTMMGIATVLTSLVLLFTSQNEESLPTFAYIIHAAALVIGGVVTGRRSSAKGWYHGGMMGIVYGLIVLLVGFLGFDRGVNLQSLILLAVAFTAAAVGGIMGVNTRKN